MALTVQFTRTLPLYPNGSFLQWDLGGAAPDTYQFRIERSGSPEGPWEVLADGLTNTYNYVDRITAQSDTAERTPVNQLSLVRGIYYRVTVTNAAGAVARAVSAVEPYLQGRQRLIKRKILRDLGIKLRKLEGVEVAVCKRMRWGPRCTACYDAASKTVVRTHDPACFGTGFRPGYFTPITTWAERTPTSVDTQTTPEGESDTSLVMVTLLDYPAVTEGDVLVFLRDNRRFLVKKMLPPELRTEPVYQTITASELARSSIEYRIPVDALRVPALF